MSLTGLQRAKTAEEAYLLAAKRSSYTEIAGKLGISRQLASTLVKEQRSRVAATRDGEDDREHAIATYEAVINEGWRRMAKLDDRSLNVSGVMNSIVSSQKAIDDITGVKAPARSENRSDFHFHDDSRSLEDYFAELDRFRESNSETGIAEPLDSATTNR